MTNAQDFSHPPSWLPLRVVCGSLLAAAVVLLTTQTGPWSERLTLEMPAPELWQRCAASLVVLVIALLLALSLGLAAGLLARRLGGRVEACTALLGRALACIPIAMVAWGFVGVWTGHFGLPVETLMPAELPLQQDAWQITLARMVWEYLAPALLLALPLTGEVLHAMIIDAELTVDLRLILRARGVPPGILLWRHHLRQMLPLLRARLQALALMVPAYLILVEDVLRFMGWGGWMAQCLRGADARAIALGLLTGGALVAVLCGLTALLPGSLRAARNRLTTVAWLPWPLWMLGAMALPALAPCPWLVVWFAVLISSSASWHEAWTRVEQDLPLEPARAAGGSYASIWLTHLVPMQLRMLAAWICTVLAQTLLWITAACALQPRLVQQLDSPLSSWLKPLAVGSPQDTARLLADPWPLLQAGGGIALAALCLIQVSRIVQPRPS